MNGLMEKHAARFEALRAEMGRSLKLRKPRVFNIVHQMNIERENLWISVNITPSALCGLFAYIEHAVFDITNACEHSLAESEIVEIVDRFYFDVGYLQQPPEGYHYEIDLYENWERHAEPPYIEGMPELHRDGLLDFVREMSIKNDWKQERMKA